MSVLRVRDYQMNVNPTMQIMYYYVIDYCKWHLSSNIDFIFQCRVKDIGSTVSGRKGADDSMTLQSQRFQIGDYLDIAITPPNRTPAVPGRMRPY